MEKRTTRAQEELTYYLLAEIKRKFGSQQALADKLKQTQGNISRKLKNPSKNFLQQLNRVGIKVPDYISEVASIPPMPGDGAQNERLDKLLIEMGKLIGRVEALEEEVRRLGGRRK